MTASLISSFMEEEWQWQLSDNPEYASQAGQHAHDGDLQDLSPGAFDRRAVHGEATLARARALLAAHEAEGASVADTVHLKLFINDVASELRAFELGCHLYPINSIGYGGVHNNFLEALDWLAEGEAGQAALVSRLEKLPEQIAQYTELLRAGMAAGRVASQAMLRAAGTQLAAFAGAFRSAAPPAAPAAAAVATAGNDASWAAEAEALLGAGPVESHAPGCACGRHKTAGAAPGQIAALVARLPAGMLTDRAAAATQACLAAVARLAAFVDAEYAPAARATPGCLGLPGRGDGGAIYAHCLAYHTTTSLTPAEVHAEGLAQVARIEGRYQTDVLDALGFAGDFGAFVAAAQGDPAHCFGTVPELLAGYRALTARIEAELPKWFERIPPARLEVVEKNSATAPAAYYMQGTADGARPGRFYVNVSNLDKRPKYEMCALALHEGIPGHHLQGSLAIENAALPSFLRFLEDRRYEFCPARRQLYAAYLEGWALYCEALGEEMGIYGSPLEIFGRLSMEMMRAVRLVIDTGIHDQGWSVERAIEYMAAKTGMHHHECEAECFRYEAWPGQACAYKVGEIAIWRMRRAAEAALGAAFDIRRFHTVLLGSGPLPLDVLEALVQDWVQRELGEKKQ